ncbi:MAG: hypothetical protein IJJ74_05870 [Eubacterium sp.]|nr:hypothetical protein [Eubacterium sp.]
MENKKIEKELKRYFKENGVPNCCASEFYYTMFMPKGVGEKLKRTFLQLIMALAVPAVLIILLWNTIFMSFKYDRKVLYSIILGAVWIVLFIVIYFLIYVNTKVKHLEVIREGRKYRDQIRKNTGSKSKEDK